jgi:hypothetical protein
MGMVHYGQAPSELCSLSKNCEGVLLNFHFTMAAVTAATTSAAAAVLKFSFFYVPVSNN